MREKFSASMITVAIAGAAVSTVISVSITRSGAQAPATSPTTPAQALKTPWDEPDLQGIWASSLDNPNNFKPQVHVWTGSAASWNVIDDHLSKIAKAPNQEQFNALLAENK